MTNQSIYVEARETIRVKNSLLCTISDGLNLCSAVSIWIDLTVMKMEAKIRYSIIPTQK